MQESTFGTFSVQINLAHLSRTHIVSMTKIQVSGEYAVLDHIELAYVKSVTFSNASLNVNLSDSLL